jgi:hypothetical protein
MRKYRLSFSDGIEYSGSFGSNFDAMVWACPWLIARGHDPGALIVGEWLADSVLFWASKSDATNDDGSRAIAKLVAIR